MRPLHSLPIVLILITAATIIVGCREEDRLDVAAKVNPEKMATMTTRNVMTIISDSGVPQYRLVSPVWYVYEDTDTPMWVLPGGPYLEKFDPKFNVVFTVACDSAVQYTRTQTWHLMGNVEYKQGNSVLILTQQLIWNQRDRTVRSDSFIHLEQPDKIIEGYGFEGKTSSRGKLTTYRLLHPTGVLPYDPSKFAASQGAPTPTPQNAIQNDIHP